MWGKRPSVRDQPPKLWPADYGVAVMGQRRSRSQNIRQTKMRITPRRQVLLGGLVFVVAFVVWLNFPFVSNPVTLLFNKPTAVLICSIF